jgi:hypothetical protein
MTFIDVMKSKGLKISVSFDTARRHPVYSKIPEMVLDGLYDYFYRGYTPGGFLHAVLTNDLFGAFSTADADSKAQLEALLQFLHQEVPTICYKFEARVKYWVRFHACGYNEDQFDYIANLSAADFTLSPPPRTIAP